MKKIYLIIAGVVILAAGFVLGAVIHPGFVPGGTIITNFVKGTNATKYITNYGDATNAVNYPVVFDAYYHFNADAFRFIQQNDTMTATLFTRSATVKIKDWANDSGLILGGGWDVVRSAPGVLAGYQFKNLSVLGQVTIATNWGLFLGATWTFK